MSYIIPRKLSFPPLALFFALVAPAALADVSWEKHFPDAEVKLSELGEMPVRMGRPVSKEDIDSIRRGLPAQGVIDTLGPPDQVSRDSTGRFYNYNFNLPFTSGSDVLVCQYQVAVTPSDRVTRSGWRRYLCEHIFERMPGADAPAQGEVIRLSSDVLFDFGEASLSAAGMDRVAELAQSLVDDYRDPLVTVVGHADRIGSSSANDQLSKERAETVRNVLAQMGVARESIVAEGRGQSEPLVFCRGGQVTDALKECLRPNRRVDIEVVERGAVRMTRPTSARN